jgi:hypothetical protein
MSYVTLILARTPLDEFKHRGMSGRWGRMAVLQGSQIKSAKFRTAPTLPLALQPIVPIAQAAAASIQRTMDALGVRSSEQTCPLIPFADRALELTLADGGTITKLYEFDAMERFKADSGKGFYMQTRPRTEPYELSMIRSSAVAKLDEKYAMQLNPEGRCLKVHGHGYKQQGTGAEAGILIHEAPHVGWLIGCISPREKNKRKQGDDRGPSQRAMELIFNAMGGFSVGTRASLIVLDW